MLGVLMYRGLEITEGIPVVITDTGAANSWPTIWHGFDENSIPPLLRMAYDTTWSG
jgi:hypothetical protein